MAANNEHNKQSFSKEIYSHFGVWFLEREQRLQDKRHRFLLVTTGGLTILASFFLFSERQKWDWTHQLVSNRIQKEQAQGSFPVLSSSHSASLFDLGCTDTEWYVGMGLSSNWMNVASLKIWKFIFFLVYFLCYVLLLTLKLSKHPPINWHVLSFSLQGQSWEK